MAKKGRKPKLTPELQQEIVKAIRLGNYIEVSAACAGICKQTLYNWLRRGERAKSGKYRQFLDAVQRAVAEAEVVNVGQVSRAATQGDWKAATWRLERQHRDRWGSGQKRSEEDDKTANHEIVARVLEEVSAMSDEELERLVNADKR